MAYIIIANDLFHVSTVTNEDFKGYFDKFGVITDAIVMTDKQTNRSRGFGFVTYQDPVRKHQFECGHVWVAMPGTL